MTERPDASAPGLQGPAWTPSRMELREKLAQLSSVYAALYEHAVELATTPLNMARLLLLAHAVRELANGISESLAANEGVELPSRADTGQGLRQLRQEWERHDLANAGGAVVPNHEPASTSTCRDGTGSDSDVVVPVPQPLFLAAQRLVTLHVDGSNTASQRRAILVAREIGVSPDTTVRLLKRAIDYFTSFAHLDRPPRRALPEQAEVRRQFEVFEGVVHARLAEFFEIARDLDEVLAEANEPPRKSSSEATHG